MHLSLLKSYDLDILEQEVFFDLFFQTINHQYNRQASDNQSVSLNAQDISNIEEAYILQKDNLVAYHLAVLNVLEQPDHIKTTFFKKWNFVNHHLAYEFQTCWENELFNPIPYRYGIQSTTTLSPKIQFKWSMLAQFIQMTNNQLGIHGQEELYLAYLMKESLYACKEAKTTQINADVELTF